MKQSIYNRVISILNTIITPTLLILIIIFQSIKSNSFNVVFLPIVFTSIFVYFLLKGIYIGKDEYSNKEGIRRVCESFKDVSLVLLSIVLILNLETSFKWILFSLVIVLGILLIVISSVNKQIELKYVFEIIIILMINIITLNLVGNSYLYYLMFSSNMAFIISDLVGTITKNKILVSFDIISLILLGLFFILY